MCPPPKTSSISCSGQRHRRVSEPETCLVICRTPLGLPTVSRLRPNRPLVVASDDRRVQEAALEQPGVQAVCFIEQAEPLYAVADDVCRLLGEIDSSLTALDPDLPAEVLSWGRNVEGGLTAQRVQDALLLFRSYQVLLQRTKAQEICLISEPHARWEDAVLETWARAQGVPVRRTVVRPFGHCKETVWTWLRPWAIALYYLGSIVRHGGGRLRRARIETLEGAVAFQQTSAYRKHVDNIRPLMQALRARGRQTLALCWSSSERYTADTAACQLAVDGLAAIDLERLVTVRDVMASILLGARSAWRARRASRLWKDLQYLNGPLGSLLAESLRHFLVAELPQRIRYERALAALFAHTRPVALKPSGGPESFEGRVACRLLRSASNANPPLVFHYWLGAASDWPYADDRHRPDVFLAKGPREAALAMREYGLRADQIDVVGQPRFSGYEEFADTNTAEVSRRELGLPHDARLYVGFDPGGAVRGYLSAREQADMTEALIRAARREPRLLLVVKPHPSHSTDHLRPLLAEAAPGSLLVLDRSASLRHFLNAVDVVVTKYSTLILEAALMRRASISALLDNEPRFQIYGDIAAVVHTGQQLEDLMVSLGADAAAFSAWRAEQLVRHQTYMPEHYSRNDIAPAERAAAVLERRLAQYRGLPATTLA